LLLQDSIRELLVSHSDHTENELVVIGLKHLYAASRQQKPVYLITADLERTRISVKRPDIDDAIKAAEHFNLIGATTVSVEAPDGMTYGLDELDALRG
jgi:hypothetical protein